MSTAPPGTGPPPSLNDAPDVNAQASDTSQTNGNKISFVLLYIYLHLINFIIYFLYERISTCNGCKRTNDKHINHEYEYNAAATKYDANAT